MTGPARRDLRPLGLLLLLGLTAWPVVWSQAVAPGLGAGSGKR